MIEIHHFNFEIGKREKLPLIFFFFKSRVKDTRRAMRLEKKEKGNKRDCFH